MIVLIDIGNSRIKWATYSKQELVAQNQYNYSDGDHIQVINDLTESWQKSNTDPTRILISSVASENIKQELDDKIWELYQIEPEYLISDRSYKKLQNGYIDEKHLGIDRWLNLIGAYQLNHSSKNAYCIIDCGTAITIDAVDKSAYHLGGFIVPGVNLMEQSLLDNTFQINKNMKANDNTQSDMVNYFLANNTKDAVTGGVFYSIICYLERIIEDLSAVINSEYNIYLTGGDASKLKSMLNISNNSKVKSIELKNDLIWQGMISLL